MKFYNANIYCDDRVFRKTDLEVQGDKFTYIGSVSDKTEAIDLKGYYIIPGLIDIHIHGSVNSDFSDADLEGFNKIARYLSKNGVTSFCATSMALSFEQIQKVLSVTSEFKSCSVERLSYVHGLTMEGPFFSKAKKGAQPEKYLIDPDYELFMSLNNSAAEMIRIIGLAPELDGAMQFINEVSNKVTVALAHTDCKYEVAIDAFNNGASHIMHLYNAMPPFHHRNPGLIGAAADNDSVTVELICDGLHIHESVIRATFKLFGTKRIVLVSDSIRSCGLSDGKYSLGGQLVNVINGKATLPDDTLAGANTNLFQCMKNAIKYGIKIEDAICSSTENPAKVIGVFDKTGSITIGKFADFIICDKDFNIKDVFVKGKKIF